MNKNLTISKMKQRLNTEEEHPDLDKNDKDIGIYFRAIENPDLLLRNDSKIISNFFNVTYDKMMIFRIYDADLEKFKNKIISDKEYPFQSFRVVHNKLSLEPSDAGFIRVGDDNIKVMNRDYGFLCIKSDFEKLSQYIQDIKLTPENYLDEELDKVFWTQKTLSLKNDVKFFSKSRKWFDDRDLPYSRSYLLYGPPGNGKTSAIRAISKYFQSRPSQFSFTASFDDPDAAFNSWVLGQPTWEEEEEDRDYRPIPLSPINNSKPKIRILLLEDIDRFFSKDEGLKTSVSFSTVLNALDGVIQRRNSILIATANNPERIDTQVLCRPGRFDLRVPFEPPSEEAIFSYLKEISKNDELTESCIAKVAESSKGHSFSFVKSIYMSAASKSFSRSSYLVSNQDIEASLSEFLGNLGREIKSSKVGAGF